MEIISYPNDQRVHKVLIAAAYGGLDIKFCAKSPMEVKVPEYLALNPNGKVPILKTPQGGVWESNAIFRYVGKAGKAAAELCGADPFESAQVDMWIDWTYNEIQDLVLSKWGYAIIGFVPYNKAVVEDTKKRLHKNLGVLEEYLLTRTYLVGDRVTLADIALTCILHTLFGNLLDDTFREPYPNVMRHFMTCIAQPEFNAVIGEAVFIDKTPLPPKPEKGKKEGKKKEGKKEGKKKEEKKVEEEEEEAPKKEEKKPNPLDLLPAPKMVMDAWKRCYSNNDTRPVALPWLWENVDANDYCFYRCKYLYPEDLTLTFMSMNLIGGWFQRLDRVRKYAFGSVCIDGEDSKHDIVGAWMFRGPEVPAEMKESDDYELYAFEKLDHTKPEDRKFIEDMFAWDVDGRELDGKIFK